MLNRRFLDGNGKNTSKTENRFDKIINSLIQIENDNFACEESCSNVTLLKS